MVIVLRAFTGGKIKARSKPGDGANPTPPSACAASTFQDGECTLFDAEPSTLKTKCGRLGALTTSLQCLSVCTRV